MAGILTQNLTIQLIDLLDFVYFIKVTILGYQTCTQFLLTRSVTRSNDDRLKRSKQTALYAIKYLCLTYINLCFSNLVKPPLWSIGQSFWLQIQRSRVRSPGLPDFLSSSGSGTGSTQPREPREVN